jgi:hypothetical protein
LQFACFQAFISVPVLDFPSELLCNSFYSVVNESLYRCPVAAAM